MNEYTQIPQNQPKMYMLDATKCKSIAEIGLLFNALGIAVSMEYATENSIEHLLIKNEDEAVQVELELPKLTKL